MSGIGVVLLAASSRRGKDSGSPDLRLEGQARSRGSTNSSAPNDSVLPEPDLVTRHCSKVGVFLCDMSTGYPPEGCESSTTP